MGLIWIDLARSADLDCVKFAGEQQVFMFLLRSTRLLGKVQAFAWSPQMGDQRIGADRFNLYPVQVKGVDVDEFGKSVGAYSKTYQL